MRDPARLEVWNSAIELAERVYELTATLPDIERYGLVSQCRRAAVSIAANIAEGYGRGLQREFARFLRIASGSATELHTLLVITGKLGLGDVGPDPRVMDQLDHVGRMLTSLVNRIEERLSR